MLRSIVILTGLSLLTGCYITLPALAGNLTGQVVGVIDGDTIDVNHDGKPDRIRLNGIDTPGEGAGLRAKEFTEDLVVATKTCELRRSEPIRLFVCPGLLILSFPIEDT
jgi:endonuclease YncB( thermonuclease family)